MANRYFQEKLMSLIKGYTQVAGYVDLSASGVPTASILGAAVTKTGTGRYTITLADKYDGVIAVHASLQAAVPVDLVPQVLSQDVSGAKTVVIQLLAAAVPTDVVAAARLYVTLSLRNSSLLK